MSLMVAPWFTAWHGKRVTVTVIFDGYNEDPSIKDNTHQRRGEKLTPKRNIFKIELKNKSVIRGRVTGAAA